MNYLTTCSYSELRPTKLLLEYELYYRVITDNPMQVLLKPTHLAIVMKYAGGLSLLLIISSIRESLVILMLSF